MVGIGRSSERRNRPLCFEQRLRLFRDAGQTASLHARQRTRLARRNVERTDREAFGRAERHAREEGDRARRHGVEALRAPIETRVLDRDAMRQRERTERAFARSVRSDVAVRCERPFSLGIDERYAGSIGVADIGR